MTNLNLDFSRYADRIGYRGPRDPTVDVLQQLHRHHTLAVPFENLDVQLGVALDTSIEAAYDKIVNRRRGGWCYEQNGLFGAVLSTLGFEVTRLAAGVMMHEKGADRFGNHLCLMVKAPGTEQRWLADVGYGGSMLHAIPLSPGEHSQPPYALSISSLGEGWLRFCESAVDDAPFCFDFPLIEANEALLSSKCVELQTAEDSSFVLSLVAQRRTATQRLSLRGRVLRTFGVNGTHEQLLESPEQLVDTLVNTFSLQMPAVAELWPRICERHDELFPERNDNR
ncbi:MAG: arylamine N-acetyltransferase [Pseudomonadota bacterium]